MDRWFGELGLDLVAGHGVWIRERGGGWRLAAPLSRDWKEEVKQLFREYASKASGVFVKEKDYSLA